MNCRCACVFLVLLGAAASASAQPLTIENITPAVWPSGEEVVLRFHVRGPGALDKLSGIVQVTPEGRPRASYPLTFHSLEKNGAAVFQAVVAPSSVDLRYEASIKTINAGKAPFNLRFEPRPVIVELMAWTSPPKDFPHRPNGRAYETPQAHGDVTALPGSTARVRIRAQKPIRSATIELFGRAEADDNSEVVLHKVPLKIKNESEAEGTFALAPFSIGYRIIVTDEHGFANVPALRRSIRIHAEEPPQVHLLRDSFGGGGDFDLEGLPVPLGGRIRIPYVCHAPHGMSKAAVLYRVLKIVESGREPDEESPWVRLALAEVVPGKNDGPFDLKTGVFANMDFDKQVPFHTIPSPNPDVSPGRTSGGGRYFLKTVGLIDEKGPRQLKSGDRIEYCVEIHGPPRDPIDAMTVGRSETRVVTILSLQEFTQWFQAVSKEDERVRRLELQQRGVFEQK